MNLMFIKLSKKVQYLPHQHIHNCTFRLSHTHTSIHTRIIFALPHTRIYFFILQCIQVSKSVLQIRFISNILLHCVTSCLRSRPSGLSRVETHASSGITRTKPSRILTQRAPTHRWKRGYSDSTQTVLLQYKQGWGDNRRRAGKNITDDR